MEDDFCHDLAYICSVLHKKEQNPKQDVWAKIDIYERSGQFGWWRLAERESVKRDK